MKTFLLFLTACSWTSKVTYQDRILTNAGRMVKITNRLPPVSCIEIDSVYAQGMGRPESLLSVVEKTKIHMRNLAAEKKANFVTIETHHTTKAGKDVVVAFTGTGYNCMLAESANKVKKSLKILEESIEEDLEQEDLGLTEREEEELEKL